MLRYRIETGSNIWKRHLNQITNVGLNISLDKDTISKEMTWEHVEVKISY